MAYKPVKSFKLRSPKKVNAGAGIKLSHTLIPKIGF